MLTVEIPNINTKQEFFTLVDEYLAVEVLNIDGTFYINKCDKKEFKALIAGGGYWIDRPNMKHTMLNDGATNVQINNFM